MSEENIPISVQVKPGSSKEGISIENGIWIIKIREKPIDGAANTYLLSYLCRELNIKSSEISLVKGTRSRFKKLVLSIDKVRFKELNAKYSK